ncbi:hypothetical protein L2E82_33805 [Cichorium intybus]|uniref:Uncharacterized protein n=1 Tax=Cichorium intybus TaxID=13427 RepID=A0ACB9BL69_CICIN|nr:hypothetical protein L2E82_33805 [Cichorium intybus]
MNIEGMVQLANVLHTKELARRLQEVDCNVMVNCVHHGIVRTGLTRDHEGFIIDFVFFMTLELLKTIPQVVDFICLHAFSKRNASYDGRIHVWNFQSGKGIYIHNC